MKSLINKLVLLFIFWDNIFLPISLGFDFKFNYLVMVAYIFYYVLTHSKISLSTKNLVYLIAGVVVFCGLNFYIGISRFLILKQVLLISITLVFSFFLINSYEFNLKKIFKDYINIIFFASVIVVVQIVGVVFNLSFLVDFSYLGFDTGGIVLNAPRGRFHSWFYEPSFMAYAFTPVVFVSVCKLFKIGNLISRQKACFIIIISLMTQSSIGFLGFLLSILIVGLSKYPILKRPLVLFLVTFSLVIGSVMIYRIPPVKLRVNHTIALFWNDKVTAEDIIKTNLSTYALYSNYEITKMAFKKSPLFGTGIGTYELNYDNYLEEVIPDITWREFHKLNRQDADSLLFRILVEMGFVGVLLALYFVVRNRIKYRVKFKTDLEQSLWIINNAIFILIFLRLVRQGHYTMLGFIMFILIYLFSYNQAKSIKQNT
jgi:hypothetical protein